MAAPARRLLAAAAVLVAGWALAELIAWAGLWIVDGRPFDASRLAEERAALAAASLPPEAAALARRVVHPYLGWVGNPRRPFVPGPQSYAQNEFGFADDASSLQERAPDRVIIAITGGSMALRFGALGTIALAEALRRSPAFADREIVFVRLGTAGYKQPQQLMSLSYLLSIGAEFDYVIALDGFNEVAFYEPENWPARIFPAFPRRWHELVRKLPDPAERRWQGEIALLDGLRADLARRLSAALWRHSPLVNLLWRFGDGQLRARRSRAELALLTYAPPDLPYAATGPRFEYADRGELYADLVAIWARSSEALHHLCEGAGIRYFHFLQPNQYVQGSKPLSRWERRRAIWDAQPYRPGAVAGYPLLVHAGRELAARGVRFHDLTRVFADVEETLYIDSCCHVNERGHELLAAAIAAALVEDAAAPQL